MAPQISTNEIVQSSSKSLSISIAGVTPEFLDVRSFEIDKGRFISKSDVKSARSYVVIGPDLQEEFFSKRSSSIGESIRIKDHTYEIIGILKPKGAVFGNNQDNWTLGSARVIVKYSEFTTIVWKLDGTQYSRFIIDGYSDKKDEAVAHNFITRDGYEDILQAETIVVIQGPIYVDEATTLPSVLTVGVGPVYVLSLIHI